MNEQQDKFIVYKSSAGSGKTFTLVREYLKIVLQNPDHFRRVLAVTFTNKAANELKSRVVRYLIDLSDRDKYSESDAIVFLLPQLSKQLKMTESQVSERALAVLRLIMHKYSEFSISTIDSFTHRIIRTFAYDLKIPMNFEVELDSDTLLAESVDLLISQVGIEQKLTRILVDFIEKKAGDERSWHIENDLQKFGNALLDEESIDPIAELRHYDLETFITARGNILRWKSEFEEFIKNTASEILEIAISTGITEDVVHGKSKGVLTFLRNLASGKFDKLAPNTYTKPALESGEWLSKNASDSQRAALSAIAREIISAGRAILERIGEDMENYILSKLLLTHLYSTALLGEIEKTLTSLCSENNKVLISEFNRRISNIVREQPAPFIYERLGEKYHHFLLDEFQDTSVLQWHNLLPLIENSLASARLNLVVGDSKQSIYRWRSGEPEQFEQLPRLIGTKDPVTLDREKTLVREYREENLAVNHRSSPVIVEFNNLFFDTIQPLLPAKYSDLYRHARQQASKQNKPGLVRIEAATAGENGQTYEEAVYGKILSVISELKEDRYHLNEITILCRSNKNASNIATYLIKQNIRVVSAESLLLTQSQNVNFLIAWIFHLKDRTSEIPLAHILEFFRNRELIKPGEMEEVFTRKSAENKAGEFGGERIHKFQVLLLNIWPDFDYHGLRRMDLFGLTQYLIDYFTLNRNSDSYLRFFMDAVLKFTGNYKGGLQEFINWWETESTKASVVIPEGINAVRIMTIHKAKGLQFPVVIFPFADEQVRPTRKNIWVPLSQEFVKPLKTAYLPVQSDLAETVYSDMYLAEMERSHIDMVNVLYVALTRPEERLYVITKQLPEKTDRANSVPKLFSAYFQAEGSWDKERTCYQYGGRWLKPTPEISEEEIPLIAGIPEKGRRSLQLLLRRHAPEVWDMEQPSGNREWGNLVHLALSRIGNAGDVESVLREMLVQGVITDKKHDQLGDLLKKLMSWPGIAHLFSTSVKVRNEPEILTAEGKLYRPDRVIFQDNKVTIVDFKTGSRKEGHNRQVIHYAGLLRQMGYTLQGGYLLYIDFEPELIKVI